MKAGLLVAAAALLGACGLAMSTEERIERAETALAEREYQAASLDLKRVLQDEPGNTRARILLGRAFLNLADPASAEAELRRALSLGADPSDVQRELATALWRQSKYDVLLDEIEPSDALTAAGRADILVLRGNAWLATGNVASARAEFEQALATTPDNVDAELGIVSSYVQDGDLDTARERIDALRARFETEPVVWNASGSVYSAAGDHPRAIEFYERARALASEPEQRQLRLEALAGLVTAHLQAADPEAATAAIADYRKISPNDIAGRVLDAQVRLSNGDTDGAITILETVLKQMPTLGSANFLMGLAHPLRLLRRRQQLGH